MATLEAVMRLELRWTARVSLLSLLTQLYVEYMALAPGTSKTLAWLLISVVTGVGLYFDNKFYSKNYPGIAVKRRQLLCTALVLLFNWLVAIFLFRELEITLENEAKDMMEVRLPLVGTTFLRKRIIDKFGTSFGAFLVLSSYLISHALFVSLVKCPVIIGEVGILKWKEWKAQKKITYEYTGKRKSKNK